MSSSKSRQPLTDKETHKVNRKNWNDMMERELGEGYSFTKKKCFVCGSLSYLIKDCDYYEKKMAREAEVKRVVNTGNKDSMEDLRIHGGSVTFGGSKGYISELEISQVEQEFLSEASFDEGCDNCFQQSSYRIGNLPHGMKVIGTKWVYRNKRDERGVVVRNKARLVAPRVHKEEGLQVKTEQEESFISQDKIEEAIDVDVHFVRSIDRFHHVLNCPSRHDIMYAVWCFVYFSDSKEEEPEAQWRKSQDDPLASLVQGLVTPSMKKVNASEEEQVEDISPNTLEAAKTLSRVASLKLKSIDKGRRYKRRKETNIKISTISEQVSTGSAKRSIPSPDKGQRAGKSPMIIEETPKKSKEQTLQEEASLAEAIRLDTLQKEEVAKQVHLDSLLAQRIAEEEELNEQQKKRRAQVQFEAQHYTDEDWDLIRANIEANA
ncbi:hypothetical protein Tco_1111642 [Tanacetum coccineum]|uniref:CCHC-type domain-containing protein n=1 Tax=Tanacetum coccineum TaxID=301880 RepID=A0ABQ5IQN1_9ASTR